MNGFATVFLLVSALALFSVPRRLAALPLLVGTCYMTLGQGFEIGPFSFGVLRILILVGVIRLVVRGERLPGGMAAMDWLMLAWGGWALIASAFHQEPGTYLIGRMGLVYNTLGVYFLMRCFCESPDDFIRVITFTAILLVPVALEMFHEQLTGRNLFAFLGGVPEQVDVRNGRLRSQGPFGNAILAGTVGAVCAPLMVGIWRQCYWPARVGLAACLLMVFTSASSGPLMSLLLAGFALVLWRWRQWTRQMRIAAVVGYVLLDLVMKAPAYYLIARIDLAGGSTGWHRAALIESAIKHLNEWWWAGTDYTRHWMPTGVRWSENHTDITNHYLQCGVTGGLPSMALFIMQLACGFSYVGAAVRAAEQQQPEHSFLCWALGASLFAHAATCISVSYFDQSFLFLCMDLAATVSVRASVERSVSAGESAPARRPATATPLFS